MSSMICSAFQGNTISKVAKWLPRGGKGGKLIKPSTRSSRPSFASSLPRTPLLQSVRYYTTPSRGEETANRFEAWINSIPNPKNNEALSSASIEKMEERVLASSMKRMSELVKEGETMHAKTTKSEAFETLKAVADNEKLVNSAVNWMKELKSQFMAMPKRYQEKMRKEMEKWIKQGVKAKQDNDMEGNGEYQRDPIVRLMLKSGIEQAVPISVLREGEALWGVKEDGSAAKVPSLSVLRSKSEDGDEKWKGLGEKFEKEESSSDSSSGASGSSGGDKKGKSSDSSTSSKKKKTSTSSPFSSSKKSSSSDDEDPVELPNWRNLMMAMLFTTIGVGLAVWLFTSSDANAEMDFDTFREKLLERGDVQKLVVMNDVVHVYVNDRAGPAFYFRIGNPEHFEKKLEGVEREMGREKLDDRVPIVYDHPSPVADSLKALIPTLLLIGIAVAIWRAAPSVSSTMGGAGGKGGRGLFDAPGMKKKSSLVTAEMKPNTKFSDVAGLDEAKVEIMEFVSFLKNPTKYTDLGAKIPRGALLVGPPGTGKTLLAKATAGEAGVPFFSTTGSDFVEMFVGVGPARVRELFAAARKKAPCIVFIDEIDAVGRARSSGAFHNDERENTLNQLLVEMDGFNTEASVVVLAGTNRSDILDKALLRPGRFDRNISIDPPTKSGRVEIFKVHLKPIKLAVASSDEIAERLADLTPGFSGADIANVCNEAALIAARNDKTSVDLTDLEAAIERVIGGLERKTKVLDPAEKKHIAYHEAGHAIVGWFLEHTDPLLKVSIIPRGSAALGYAQYQSKDQFLISKEQLLDRMCLTLGGRVAEKIIFQDISTGAQDDLDRVTNIAFNQITKYGMSPRVGLLSFKPNQSEFNLSHRLYSAHTAKIIDDEVRDIVNAAYQRTFDLLTSKQHLLESVAQRLLQKEVLSNADMTELLGERPYPSKPEEGKHTPTSPVDNVQSSSASL